MHKITFNLKDRNSASATIIFMYVTFGGERIKISTKEKIHPRLWDFKNRKVIQNDTKLDRIRLKYGIITTRVSNVSLTLKKYVEAVDTYFIKSHLEGRSPDVNSCKRYLLDEVFSNRREERSFIGRYISFYISELQSKVRKKNNGRSYKESSITCFKNLLQAYDRFEAELGVKIKWDHFCKTNYYQFIKWHEEKGYSVNYTGKHIKDLKSIMRTAYEEGVHTNEIFRMKFFSVPKEVKKKVPLSIIEVEKMKELDLEYDIHKRLSRDVFVLGCYVGLRISDLKRINSRTIYEDDKGKYIKIVTMKTETEVQVPLGSKAEAILRRYNYELPYFSEQMVNRHLKELGKMIGLDGRIASKLSTHYARATFAKIAYDSGIPSLLIMEVTGHKSERNFLRYMEFPQSLGQV